MLVVMVGMWLNNRRVDDLNNRPVDLNSRIGDLRSETHRGFEAIEKLITEKLKRVEDVLAARLKLIENRLNIS